MKALCFAQGLLFARGAGRNPKAEIQRPKEARNPKSEIPREAAHIYFTLPLQSDALRAEDGSRSGPTGPFHFEHFR
jgi:hypothetical protein